LKDLFPFGSDISSPKFTEHALNVMNAVDLAVQNLDNPDVLIPQLQELGRAHAMFELTDKEFGVRFGLIAGSVPETSVRGYKHSAKYSDWAGETGLEIYGRKCAICD